MDSLKNCIISNPAILNSSKKVLIFAEKTAKEYNLLTSDLILAAVWHCLNQTKQTHTSDEKTCVENKVQKKSPIEDDKRLQNADRTRSEQSESSHVEGELSGNSTSAPKTKLGTGVLGLLTENKEKQQSSNESVVSNTEEKVKINDNLNHQQNSQVAKHSATASNSQIKAGAVELNENTSGPVYSKKNTDDLEKEKCDGKTGGVSKPSPEGSVSDLNNIPDKKIKTQSQTNSKETKSQANLAEDGNVHKTQNKGISGQTNVHAVQNTTQLTSAVKEVGSYTCTKVVESKKQQVVAADVEIISIDDEDSNDANDGSTEKTVAQTETIVSEEKAEDKEPDYFDMDCDEIDDNSDYEEINFDTSTEVPVKETKTQEETSVKNNESEKNLDVTIISDDEDDFEVKSNEDRQSVKAASDLLRKPSASPGKSQSKDVSGKSGVVKNQVNARGKENQTMQEESQSRRKQAHTNVKVDILEHVERKAEENIVNNSTNKRISTALSCPVAEHMEGMTKQGSSSEQADDQNSPAPLGFDNVSSHCSSTATMLGLVPVNSPQKSIKGEEPVHIVPSLASNQSIYVSSGMIHGCIPSLPPVHDLQPVHTSGSGFADVYHSLDPIPHPQPSDYDSDLQSQSALYGQPQIGSTQSLDSDVRSPPRKKRLLDYDKKWHMEPKYSPEQDKVHNNTNIEDVSKERKRKQYNIEEKLRIIKRLSSGETQASVSRDLNIADSTLRGWIKDESKLREELVKFGDRVGNKKRLRHRQMFEKELYNWVLKKRSEESIPTGPEIRCKAREMAEEWKVQDTFRASNGWLSRFRTKYGLHVVQKKTAEKYSPYLALPGGIQGSSVLNDWTHPGYYTSISQFTSSPSIGIETVDSDYMNYQSLNVESYLDGDDDDDFNVSDDDDNDNASDSSDEADKRKSGVKRGTRGRGRGRSRVRGVRGRSRGTRGSSRGVRGKGRGFTRGLKYGSDRGRGTRRSSVRGYRGRARGRPSRGSVGNRRGLRTRGLRTRGGFNKLFPLKSDQSNTSPSKFNSLIKGSGLTTGGRKIGFYSLRLGKPKTASDGATKRCSRGVVRRGRRGSRRGGLHRDRVRSRSVSRDKLDVSRDNSEASQPRKRGRPSLRSRGIVRRGRGTSKPPETVVRRGRAASKAPEDIVRRDREASKPQEDVKRAREASKPAEDVVRSSRAASKPREDEVNQEEEAEIDDYLALPGGIQGSSVLNDWTHPGYYTSISQFTSSPSIGIETVDSDYMNYQSLNVESYLDGDNDDDFNVSDDDDNASDSSDEADKRKSGVKRGTRGRGRGRSRVRGVRSRSRGTRGSGRWVRGKGRGFTRGLKYGSDRGRGTRRSSVRGYRGRARGRPSSRGSVGNRRGLRTRGLRTRGGFNKLFPLKCDQSNTSPSKFNSLIKGSGFTTRGRKIGFFSLRFGKLKTASDGATKRGSRGVVRRGRGRSRRGGLHRDRVRSRSVSRDKSDVSRDNSEASQPRKRGRPSLRSRGIVRRGRGTSKPPETVVRRGRAASKAPEDIVRRDREASKPQEDVKRGREAGKPAEDVVRSGRAASKPREDEVNQEEEAEIDDVIIID